MNFFEFPKTEIPWWNDDQSKHISTNLLISDINKLRTAEAATGWFLCTALVILIEYGCIYRHF